MEDKFLQMEQIDRYVNGHLTDDENLEFRQRLAEDEEFRLLFDDMEIMAEGIRVSASASSLEEKLDILRDTLLIEGGAEIDAERKTKNTVERKTPVIDFFSQYKLAIAAGVSLLVVSLFVFNRLMPVNEEALFAQHFEPYNYSSMTRGSDESQATKSELAYAAYANENYLEATVLFNEVIPASPKQLTDRFFLGNAYLALGEGNKAVETFSLLVVEGGSMQVLAQWYLGLSYLQTGDRAKAVEALTKVGDAGLEHAEEAKDIVNMLE